MRFPSRSCTYNIPWLTPWDLVITNSDTGTGLILLNSGFVLVFACVSHADARLRYRLVCLSVRHTLVLYQNG